MVEWDVGKLTRDLIDNNWSDDVDRPSRIELLTQDDRGIARTRVRRNADEYVIIQEPGERSFEPGDIFHESEDFTSLVAIEASTSNGRERREELFSEIKRIIDAHRHRAMDSPTPGHWDRLVIQTANVFDDQNFGWHVVEFSVEYSRHSEIL